MAGEGAYRQHRRDGIVSEWSGVALLGVRSSILWHTDARGAATRKRCEGSTVHEGAKGAKSLTKRKNGTSGVIRTRGGERVRTKRGGKKPGQLIYPVHLEKSAWGVYHAIWKLLTGAAGLRLDQWDGGGLGCKREDFIPNGMRAKQMEQSWVSLAGRLHGDDLGQQGEGGCLEGGGGKKRQDGGTWGRLWGKNLG